MASVDLLLFDVGAAPPPPAPSAAAEAPAAIEEKANGLPLPLSSSVSKPATVDLHFFVACTGVDGTSLARSTQTLMRGALNMLAGSASGSKSPRSRPATDVNVEVRMAREVLLPGASSELSPLESASAWSERRRSRNPVFSVGFCVRCQTPMAFDRHVQIMLMIPDENSHSNKNSQVFGYALTSFQEMYTIATSGNYQQKLTLPVHSSIMDGATVELRFVALAPQPHPLYRAPNPIFRAFRFYPQLPEDQEAMQTAATKLVIEEAAEVEYSVAIPLQLLRVCESELVQMHQDWRARYDFNRRRQRQFDDDAEALRFAHDVYRVQVICGRNLKACSSVSSNGGGAAEGSITSSRPSALAAIGGRGAGFMNRLKTQAGRWAATDGSGGNRPTLTGGSGGNGAGSESRNLFVQVKYADGGITGSQELLVGKTNTEYDSANPVWSSNATPAKCPHAKPVMKFSVSASLPSHVERSRVNALKQFVFYRSRATTATSAGSTELTGWLRFELYHESYSYMTGVEQELVGEVLLPLQSVRDAMAKELETISSDTTGAEPLQGVTSLTLVDWFDVRSVETDEICGQIQLRINILRSNATAASQTMEEPSLLAFDSPQASESPRRERLEADCLLGVPNTSLEDAMPLAFLYPHVLHLQKQIANVSAMIRLCESLIDQQITFKSSEHKKRADIQGLPTNLHVSYFRIFRNFGSQALAGALPSQAIPPADTSSTTLTMDLLGLDSPRALVPAQPAPLVTAPASLSDPLMAPESHVTISCGAPTAHAMGLSEYGLREMELEIHRLQGILDKATPHFTASSFDDDGNALVSEDITDHVYSSIQDSIDDIDDETELNGVAEAPTLTASTSTVEETSQSTAVPAGPSSPTKQSNDKKYSGMAARAVAGAKAKAQKRMATRKKSPALKSAASTATDSDDNVVPVAEVKYPTLRTEPDDGMDPATSVAYASRILCRLEMLRAEYYLRKSVAVSQSVSSLVTCFMAELDLCLQQQDFKVLDQMAQIGFLIGWESLISSHGKELRMLSDAWVAIKCLETFAFQLYEGSFVQLVKREDIGYTLQIPVSAQLWPFLPESLRQGQLITITSVLFTQGINEMQSLANMVGHAGVSMQSKINSSSFRALVGYYNRFTTCGVGLHAETSVGSHPDEILRNLRQSVEGENSASKNTCILFHAEDAVRSMNGGRVTFCKSGKDRTAMSATLEQARLLVQRKRQVLQEIETGSSGGADSGPLEEVKEAANIMREFGVRIEIARKNVGRTKYSFNSIQRKLLPEIYRPPVCTIQDMVTSVTARDS